MIKHSFNQQLKILELVVQDVVTIDQIIEYYVTISADNSLPRDLKTLIDCSKATFQIDLNKKEIDKASLTVQKTTKAFASIHEAAIVINPYGTVIATLFSKINNGIKNYNFEFFCTKDAALKWLSSS